MERENAVVDGSVGLENNDRSQFTRSCNIAMGAEETQKADDAFYPGTKLSVYSKLFMNVGYFIILVPQHTFLYRKK